jgi:6-phosphogluconolactonase
MGPAHLQVFGDADGVAEAAGMRIQALARDALDRRGQFRLGLSGGRTPVATYRWLVHEAAARAPRPVDWPPDHPDSNFRLVRELLIDPLGIPPTRVHRMKGEYPDLAVAAEEYEARLRAPLDGLLLGIGEDGHIASLFPGGAALADREHRVLAVLDSPKPPPRRLTLTPRALAEALEVLVLATGVAKAAAVAAALEGAGPASEIPARLVCERTWLIDREAASLLRQAPRQPRGRA